MPPDIAEVGNVVDEIVGVLGESDQIVVHCGVAREHHGPVRGVETIGQSGYRMAVRDGNGRDPDNSIVEDDDRDLDDALGPGRNGNVDCPHQRARIRHASVQRHDVQMVGVASEDVLDQIRRARRR